MTKTELTEWFKGKTKVDQTEASIDGSENRWYTKIYFDGKEYWAVNFLNEHPSSYFDGEKHHHNEFRPYKVTKKTRIIEESYYLDEGGEEIY
jgi:hypothetical protein